VSDRVTTGDIQTAYRVAGPEDAPTVVLSHALGSSSVMWGPQIEALSERYRVLCYDTRGHGDSDAPEGPYTLEGLAADAVALLDALDVEQVHWVGLSMGGMIGQAMALDHAARLRSLVLADTMAEVGPDLQPVWQQRIDTAREEGMAALWPGTAERWFTGSFRAHRAAALGTIREQFEATPVSGFVGCCEAIRRLDFLHELGAIAMPVSIVVGEQDAGTPVPASEAMYREIVGSRLFVIPEASHLSNVEQPERFNAIVLDHLGSVH